MNVRCPSCSTVFRVDPEKIPPTGVKARCARCSNVFRLDREGAAAIAVAGAGAGAGTGNNPGMVEGAGSVAATAVAPPAPAPEPVHVPLPTPPPAPAPVVTSPVEIPAPPPAPAPAPVSAAPPGKRASFRTKEDPNDRAKRIARALVSDIVAYNKDKMKTATDPASMRSEFREEIRKSWEEYVEQVGLEIAKSTPYFRDSLNEILAKGQKVF